MKSATSLEGGKTQRQWEIRKRGTFPGEAPVLQGENYPNEQKRANQVRKSLRQKSPPNRKEAQNDVGLAGKKNHGKTHSQQGQGEGRRRQLKVSKEILTKIEV